MFIMYQLRQHVLQQMMVDIIKILLWVTFINVLYNKKYLKYKIVSKRQKRYE